MNLREGTRRLALLLGVAGAIFGGFVSYLQLQSTMRQRADHQRFEQLADSRVVQEQFRKRVASKWFSLDQEQRKEALARMTPEQKTRLQKYVAEYEQKASETIDFKKYEGITAKASGDEFDQYKTNRTGPAPKQPRGRRGKIDLSAGDTPPIDLSAGDKPPADSDTSTPNEDGIKTIHWTDGFEPESIETTDGRTLYPTPAPGLWSYVTIAVLPLLGFFIPWGAVRAIGWVAAGFVTGPK